jgi:hypothetical protein
VLRGNVRTLFLAENQSVDARRAECPIDFWTVESSVGIYGRGEPAGLGEVGHGVRPASVVREYRHDARIADVSSTVVMVVAVLVLLALVVGLTLTRRRLSLTEQEPAELEKPKGYEAGGGISLAPGGRQAPEVPRGPIASETITAPVPIDPDTRASHRARPDGRTAGHGRSAGRAATDDPSPRRPGAFGGAVLAGSRQLQVLGSGQRGRAAGPRSHSTRRTSTRRCWFHD